MSRRLWASLSLATVAALPAPAVAACPPDGISLPPGSLADALIALGKQCKVSVAVKTAAVNGYRVPGQELAPETGDIFTALEQLLAESPFDYRQLGPAAVAVVARAEPAPDSDEPAADATTEEITVTGRSLTGTHLRHKRLGSYAPIDILAQPELEITGAQTIAELLNCLPAVSGNSTSTSVSNGGDGTANVTLRGMPASNTLVLINGRRIVSNGFGGETADLNTIPLSAVDRIEILKDGASAVYGSDAIAGVVNIILRRDFEGLDFNSYYGSAEKGDQQTSSHHLTWGRAFDRGHLMLSLAHYRQGELKSRDRALSATADNRQRGGTDLRSAASPGGYIALDGNEIVTNASAGTYRPWTQEDRYDYSEFTTAVVPSERWSAYSAGEILLPDDTTLFAEMMAVRTLANTTFAPTPVFTRFDNGDLEITADNPYNPFGQSLTDVRKRLLELGPREQENLTDTWRGNTGFKGAWDSWQWELTLGLHYTRAEESLSNLVDPQRLGAGLKGGSCLQDPDCVPVNLLGPTGSIDRQQQDYIRAESRVDGQTEMVSLTYITDGILASYREGDIPAAAGIEFRNEAIDFRSSDAGGLSKIGGIAAGAARGSRLVGEAFSEISIPLAREQLWFDAAVRVSDYSDFGSTANPKVALRWKALPTLMLRATYATGFRAPNLVDMNQSGYQSQEFLFDPCSRDDAATLPGCNGMADSSRIQFLTEFGGNSELQPETSDNRTIGVVWTPNGTDEGFAATLDLFDIRQNDVIDTSPQYLIDQNANRGLFPDRVQRDGQGDITKIIATRLNIGAREVRGLDLALRYEKTSEQLGQLRWSFNASHLQRYLNQAAPGAAIEDLTGTFVDPASGGAGSLPEWKANTGIYWKRKRWEGGYTIHYVDALEESFTRGTTAVTRRIGSWTSHDMQVAYAQPQGFRLALGVDNLFDRSPPFAATAFNDNHDGRTYDLSGRYLYTTLSYSL